MSAPGPSAFDTEGALQSTSDDQIIVDRADTGSVTPMSIRPDFEQVTQLAASDSEVALTLQDGAPEGTLNEYAIGGNGIVTGIFTNGLVANLAQIALASFSNNQGLYALGNNLYSPGPNAGTPQIGARRLLWIRHACLRRLGTVQRRPGQRVREPDRNADRLHGQFKGHLDVQRHARRTA